MAGIEITSPRTRMIANIAMSRKKQIGLSGGPKNAKEAKASAKKYLKEMKDIEGEDVDDMIDNIMKMTYEHYVYESNNDIVSDRKECLTIKYKKMKKV